MFDRVQLFCVGLAAAIDTALLLALIDRHNWRRVIVPLVLLVGGAWLLHVGTFIHALFDQTPGEWASLVHWIAMVAMTIGLLIMPSAVLHAYLRLRNTGFETRAAFQPSYAVAYSPVLALIPVAGLLAKDPRGTFLGVLAPYVWPYMVWLGGVNMVTAIGFFRLHPRSIVPRARSFLNATAVVLLGLTVLHTFVFLFALPRWPEWQPQLLMAVLLSPIVLALLLTYFIVRFHFMHLVLERTIVYAVMVVGLLLFQRLFLEEVWTTLSERYQVDFVLVAGAFLCMLILMHRPLRQRTAEALRYLMGESVAQLREQTRRVSLAMSALSGQPPQEILGWFGESAREALRVSYADAWLFGSAGQVTMRSCAGSRLDDDAVIRLHRELTERRVSACCCRDAPAQSIEDALDSARASLAVVLEHTNVTGLVLFGRRPHNYEMNQEQVGATMMLVEQLGTTLNNSLLQADRLAAERRALQQEKLSTLGLIASSIAHEVKNPLSSIKTIAAVLCEELGPASPHAEDLRLIVGEVDRLAGNVTELLQFARPSDSSAPKAAVTDVLNGTLRLMRHLAARHQVTVTVDIPEDLPAVRGNENSIREVFLNLLTNSIDAAGVGGCVAISARRLDGHLVFDVSDTGPGIPPECQDRLFEPFVTSKQNGTGLGLYMVGRRIREFGGEVQCHTEAGRGTNFTIRFPIGAA